MYSVPEACAEAIRTGKAIFAISGVITFADGTTTPVNDSNIANGSVEISYKCVSGDELAFGGGMLGELSMKLRNSMSRYLFYGATLELELTANYKSNGTTLTETIPMGVWNIAEAKREKSVLQITAYDNLYKLDVPFAVEVTGTAYELISSFCNEYDLEVAEDEDYYLSLPNGGEHSTFNQDSGCNTVRQLLVAVAQSVGCVLIADREGRVSCRQFGTEPSLELGYSHRYDATIADYDCNYIALRITGLGGTYEAVVNDNSAEGLVMNITDAPAWDVGVAETFQRMCNQLFEYVETINYTPSTFSTFCNPLVEPGDMVRLFLSADNDEDDSVDTLIMEINWSYRNATEFDSVGANKFLIGLTDAGDERMLRQMQSKIDRQKLIFNIFRNSGTVRAITNLWHDLGTCTFAAAEDTQGVFNGTFEIVAEKDDEDNEQTFTVYDHEGQPHELTLHDTKLATTKVEVRYLMNEMPLPEQYSADLTPGSHIITLFQPLTSITADSVNRFQVQIKLGDDETGEAYVPDLKFIGSISAQGLAETIPWDGIITVDDTVAPIELELFGDISLAGATAEATVELNDDHLYISESGTSDFTDVVDAVTIVPCFDELAITPVIVSVSRSYLFPNEWYYNSNYIEFVNTIQMKRTYVYNSTPESIDAGNMSVVTLQNEDKTTIESVVITEI